MAIKPAACATGAMLALFAVLMAWAAGNHRAADQWMRSLDIDAHLMNRNGKAS